jgi:uncharacterized membrane protein YfcA
MLIGASIVGTYTGKLILEKISETLFKKIVLGLILGVGIVTLLNQILIN